MTRHEAYDVTEAIDETVFTLIDRGVVPEADMPPRLMAALANRRLLIQKAGEEPDFTPPEMAEMEALFTRVLHRQLDGIQRRLDEIKTLCHQIAAKRGDDAAGDDPAA